MRDDELKEFSDRVEAWLGVVAGENLIFALFFSYVFELPAQECSWLRETRKVADEEEEEMGREKGQNSIKTKIKKKERSEGR